MAGSESCPTQLDPTPYDALLLLSFGGPEGPDDVVPFLENVTRGRGIPRERLKEVGQHYFLFGGVSPINAQNRALLDALRTDFAEHGLDLPVYWGNRNWAPYLTDTLREMADDGHRRIAGPGHQRLRLVLRLPPVPREPRRRAGRPGRRGAARAAGRQAPALLQPPRLRRPDDRRASSPRWPTCPTTVRDGAHLAFTTHSIPTAAADTSGPVDGHGDGGAYVAQHLDVAAADRRRGAPRRPASTTPGSWSTSPAAAPRTSRGWSRTSATTWRRCTRPGAPAVVMVPIGFVSDHMEVMYDLDTEAAAKAAELGLPVGPGRDRRAPTRASPPPCATWCWSAPRPSAAQPRRAARWARSARATTSARSAAARPREPRCPAAAGLPTEEPRMSDRTEPSPDLDRRTAGPRPGGRPPGRRPAARRPPRRPRRGRDQVQPDRRRHRDGHRRREADHRLILAERRPDDGFLGEEGASTRGHAAASAGSSTRSTAR